MAAPPKQDKHQSTEVAHRFELEKLRLEQAFERENWAFSAELASRIEYAQQSAAQSALFHQTFKDYGMAAIRSTFVLNGGALLALLAFIGAALQKSGTSSGVLPILFVPAFVKFAVGLAFSVLAMAFAFLNFFGSRRFPGHRRDLAALIADHTKALPISSPTGTRWAVWWTWWFSFGSAAVALFIFGWGCFDIALVFRGIKPSSVQHLLP